MWCDGKERIGIKRNMQNIRKRTRKEKEWLKWTREKKEENHRKKMKYKDNEEMLGRKEKKVERKERGKYRDKRMKTKKKERKGQDFLIRKKKRKKTRIIKRTKKKNGWHTQILLQIITILLGSLFPDGNSLLTQPPTVHRCHKIGSRFSNGPSVNHS